MLQNMRGHDHVINFSNSKVIDSESHRTSKTLESWHTAVTNNAENNSMLLSKFIQNYISLSAKIDYTVASAV